MNMYVIFGIVAAVVLIFAPAAAWQLVRTTVLVGGEVTSTTLEVMDAVEEACDDVRSGLRESLDPQISVLDSPTEQLAAAAVDLSLNRPCLELRRRK